MPAKKLLTFTVSIGFLSECCNKAHVFTETVEAKTAKDALVKANATLAVELMDDADGLGHAIVIDHDARDNRHFEHTDLGWTPQGD